MSLLFQVIRSSYCRGTHHKLALDALLLLRGPKALRWQSVFLRHHTAYLEGSKDPDRVFRDFENHVLHVHQGYWGGACERARYWYDATVRALRSRDWEVAAYNGGVLSHYVTDPMMPLHTAQSPAETVIHRALEWSISQTYDPIWQMHLENMGLPVIEAGTQECWLEELVTAGAEIANGYYEPLIAQYDFAAGSKNPPKGLPLSARQMTGQMLAFAVVSLSRILERACAEAAQTVEPPLALPSLDWFFASLDLPIEVALRQMSNQREAELVRQQYREFLRSGSVDATLTEDVRVIRDLCGNGSVPADPPPASDAPDASDAIPPGTVPRNPRLSLSSPVENAPSIGPQTAARLAQADIQTVEDFLAADPATLAATLQVPHLHEANLRDWQDQCRLLLDIPRLRERHARVLVASGFRTAASVACIQPEELLAEVIPFLDTAEGMRLLGDAPRPGLREVTLWVGGAGSASPQVAREMGLAS